VTTPTANHIPTDLLALKKKESSCCKRSIDQGTSYILSVGLTAVAAAVFSVRIVADSRPARRASRARPTGSPAPPVSHPAKRSLTAGSASAARWRQPTAYPNILRVTV